MVKRRRRGKLSERGQIEVNDHLQTSAKHLRHRRCSSWCHVGPQGEEEGVMVAKILAGQQPHIDYDLIPNVIYTARSGSRRQN